MNPIAGESYTPGRLPHRRPAVPDPARTSSRGPRGRSRRLDIKLPRGVLIRGKVTEAGTGRPLAGVEHPVHPRSERDDKVLSGWQAIVASQDDGSFQIAVPPGKGHLLVFGPTADYVLEEIGDRTGSTAVSPAGRATTPTPSSPTRSRPATRRARSPRRCGRA